MGNSFPKWLIVFFFLPLIAASQANRIGVPNIQNYLKSDYMAGTQNWAISQGNDGFIFFANNDGLLSYDGIKWANSGKRHWALLKNKYRGRKIVYRARMS